MPPMKPSEESTEAQLATAIQQGEAYGAALAAMAKEAGAGKQRAGEYEVSLVIEHAEGMWQLKSDDLV
jgi:hypothetical protein